jgi:hypothetical protein
MAISYNTSVVTDGLVLYLDAANIKSYPGTGTKRFDLTPNKLNGSLINGPTFSTDGGGSIFCDGTNDYIEVLDNALLDFGASNFSVEYWFKKPVSGNFWGVNKWNTGAQAGTNEWGLSIGTSGANNPAFFIQSGTTTYNTGTAIPFEKIVINAWNHMVGIREGDKLKVYLNGILEADLTPSGFTAGIAVNNVGRNLRINNSALNNFYTQAYNGIVRIYNKALSNTEVQQNLNANRGRYGI